jgi:hypothetical protein
MNPAQTPRVTGAPLQGVNRAEPVIRAIAWRIGLGMSPESIANYDQMTLGSKGFGLYFTK